MAQLTKYRTTKKFFCTCGYGRSTVPYATVLKQLSEEDKKKLEKMELMIKVDSDPNMIWCPYFEC